jgi:hypothetical protein
MPTCRVGFRCLRSSLADLVHRGLAVMISSGGGAEGVTKEQARVSCEADPPCGPNVCGLCETLELALRQVAHKLADPLRRFEPAAGQNNHRGLRGSDDASVEQLAQRCHPAG